MKYELKSYSIGETVGKSVSMYMENFFVFAAIGIVLAIPIGFLSSYVAESATAMASSIRESGDMSLAYSSIALSSLTTIASLIITAFCSAFVTKFVAANFLGEKAPFSKMGSIFAMLPAILACIFLEELAIIGGMILLIVPGIIIALGFSLGPIAVVLEGVGPVKALKRSWELSSGNKGRIFLLMLLVGLITTAINLGFNYLLGLLPAWMALPGTILITGLLMPFSSLSYVILYFSLRVEKEAFDVEYLAQAFGEHPAGPEPVDPGAAK